MTISSNDKVVITGASSGIGAIYAGRVARRGHDLILVARRRYRLEALAQQLSHDTGRHVEVIVADLSSEADVASVERCLADDTRIGALINNAGIGLPAGLVDADVETMERMIKLNVIAPVRLTRALVPAFTRRGSGAIINIGSVVGVVPELLNGVYGGSKAFVLAFSLSLHKELAGAGIRVQAVLPGATATDFWDLAGTPLDEVPRQFVMEADDMVDAALAGFDQGEVVTIPSLPDVADWDAYEAARQKLIPKLSLSTPAERYRATRTRSKPTP